MGCHVSEKNPEDAPHIDNYENLTKVHGPNLVGIGSKVSAEWLYEWLMDLKHICLTQKCLTYD